MHAMENRKPQWAVNIQESVNTPTKAIDISVKRDAVHALACIFYKSVNKELTWGELLKTRPIMTAFCNFPLEIISKQQNAAFLLDVPAMHYAHYRHVKYTGGDQQELWKASDSLRFMLIGFETLISSFDPSKAQLKISTMLELLRPKKMDPLYFIYELREGDKLIYSSKIHLQPIK